RTLLVVRLSSYWFWLIFFFVWLLLTALADGPLVSAFAVLLATPGAPPLASAVVDTVVSSLRVVLRATWPSGSNFSSTRVMVSQLISAATRTMAWPGPRAFSRMPSALRPRYCSRLRRAPSWLFDRPATESFSWFSER